MAAPVEHVYDRLPGTAEWVVRVEPDDVGPPVLTPVLPPRWRDPGPAPGASSAAAAGIMRCTRRRDTAPELALRRELHRRGLRFLVDVAPAGTNRRRRADVVLRGARIAVFVDGCFWHCCPEHFHWPKANAEWWKVKMASIVARDRDTDRMLRSAGWWPERVWEHEPAVAAADRLEELQRRRRLGLPAGPDGRLPAMSTTIGTGSAGSATRSGNVTDSEGLVAFRS